MCLLSRVVGETYESPSKLLLKLAPTTRHTEHYISLHVRVMDNQGGVCKATHALLPVEVGTHQINLPQNLRINTTRNELAISKLTVKASEMINLQDDVQKKPIHQDTRETCLKIRKAFQGNGIVVVDVF